MRRPGFETKEIVNFYECDVFYSKYTTVMTILSFSIRTFLQEYEAQKHPKLHDEHAKNTYPRLRKGKERFYFRYCTNHENDLFLG